MIESINPQAEAKVGQCFQFPTCLDNFPPDLIDLQFLDQPQDRFIEMFLRYPGIVTIRSGCRRRSGGPIFVPVHLTFSNVGLERNRPDVIIDWIQPASRFVRHGGGAAESTCGIADIGKLPRWASLARLRGLAHGMGDFPRRLPGGVSARHCEPVQGLPGGDSPRRFVAASCLRSGRMRALPQSRHPSPLSFNRSRVD